MGTVKVGPFTYTVQSSSDKESDGFDSPMWGDIKHTMLRIRIDRDSPENHKMVAVFHELLHAVNFVWKCDLDEAQTHRITNGMVEALQNAKVDLAPLRDLIDGD
jgi:hypothetical protein